MEIAPRFNCEAKIGISAMTQEPWKPVRVRGLERELIHAEEHLKTLDRDRDETKDRISSIKYQIEQETGERN
jgi:hypothetical protein